MSKYAWGENPGLPSVDNTQPEDSFPVENGTAKTTVEDMPSVTVKVDLDEIIDIPKEAINKEMVVLKEKEGKEEEINKLEESNEHLSQLFNILYKDKLISRESFSEIQSLYPEIKIEENDLTTYPSAQRASETETEVRSKLQDNQGKICTQVEDCYLTAALKLFLGERYHESFNKEELSTFVNKTSRKLTLGIIKHDKLVKDLKRQLIQLHEALVTEREVTKKDLRLAVHDKELLLAVESHLNDVSQYTQGEPIEKSIDCLISFLSEEEKQTIKNSILKERLFGVLDFVIDYTTDKAVWKRLEILDKAKYIRFTKELDDTNRAIADLFNALLDQDTQLDQRVENIEALKQKYYSQVEECLEELNIGSIYQFTPQEVDKTKCFSRLFSLPLKEIGDEIVNDTLVLGDVIEGLMNYYAFYKKVMEEHIASYLENNSSQVLSVSQQDSINYLNATVKELMCTLGKGVLHDVQVYSAQCNYYCSLLGAYRFLAEIIRLAVNVHFEHKEEVPEGISTIVKSIQGTVNSLLSELSFD